jgi:predicted ATP-grasp superfamily ATP-dependent carboligase
MVLEFEDVPELTDPVLIAAFEGWNDAGEAATSAVRHLAEVWDAEVVAALDPEEYYDFQVNRPHVHPDEGGARVIVWPTPTLYLARPPGAQRDVLLFRAPEPNVRWRSFCSTVVGLARLAGVTELVTMGALLADAPHTRPVPVSGSSSDPLLAERLSLQPSTYSGPVGINSVLSETAANEGIPSLALWAAVPHYLAEPPCPKATLALLGSLEDAIGVGLPLGSLEELSEAWQRGASEVADADPDIAEYVQELENERDTSELPEASGDAIAREFERYLRRRDIS